MKIAIVGSRKFVMINRIINKLLRLKDEYPDNLAFVSGGADGVDKVAKDFAKAKNIPIQVIRPVNPEDKFSYLLRNAEIIALSDKIIAFWDGSSKGTKMVIDYAKARGKDVEVIMDGGKN